MGRGLRTLIIDDDPTTVERVQALCDRSTRLHVIASTPSGAEALNFVALHQPEVVILGFSMTDKDEFNIARTLQQTGTPAIIITSTSSSQAIDAFEIGAVDYLLKPVKSARLELAAERAALRLRAAQTDDNAGSARELWVPHRGVLTRLALADVTRFTAERDFVRVHALNRSYLLHGTMSGIERRLNPVEYLRTHRSEIVRRDIVTGLKRNPKGTWHACMSDGTMARIGRSYLQTVRSVMDVRSFGNCPR